MTGREDCAAIVRAVVALARYLGVTTTAEGIETAEQLDWLRAEGCDQAQGFHFSRPLPVSKLGPWLRTEPAGLTYAA